MSLHILIAPSGFKESLGPEEVSDCIEEGILRALPEAKIEKLPLVDGGEGFAKVLVRVTGGTLHYVTVTGPVGQPVKAHFGLFGGPGPKTAVLEMASAAGLRLVPRDARDPLKTTTYGVGELIKAALDAGAQRLFIGSGDSGTNDGGAGMAQALGVRLLDASGSEIGHGGGELLRLERIEMSGRDSRIGRVEIVVPCNWHHVLCGPNGAARVFGPQKGASPEAVERLAAALDHYAAIIERQMGIDVRTMPGGGGSGGLVTGLHVFLNARLHPCYDIVMQYLEIDSPLRQADLVITAEGCLDLTTPSGKIPAEIARRAKRYDLPVIALVGMVGQGAEANFDHGIDAFSSILEAPVTLSEAMENASDLLTQAAERVMRLIQVGQKLGGEKVPNQVATAIQNTQSYEDSSEFLSMVSHELRTPLNLVIGYAEMIKHEMLGEISPEQEKALGQVVKHSLGLLTLINTILGTQIEQGMALAENPEQTHSDSPVIPTPSLK